MSLAQGFELDFTRARCLMALWHVIADAMRVSIANCFFAIERAGGRVLFIKYALSLLCAAVAHHNNNNNILCIQKPRALRMSVKFALNFTVTAKLIYGQQ